MDFLKRESLRYLGYHKKTVDKATEQMIEDCLQLLKNNVSPKSTYQILELSLPDDETVLLGEMHIKSRNLAKNLKNCCRAVLFAATLGAEADRLISRLAVTNMAKAAVMQASAAAFVEQYCNNIGEKIEAEVAKNHLYTRPRFSPGYGDFDIFYQKEILNILKAQKNIGLTITDSYMLTPTKSITAVMGISDEKQNCHRRGCEICGKADCAYRRDE